MEIKTNITYSEFEVAYLTSSISFDELKTKFSVVGKLEFLRSFDQIKPEIRWAMYNYIIKYDSIRTSQN